MSWLQQLEYLLEEVETTSKPTREGVSKEPSKPVRLADVSTRPVVRLKK